MNSINWGILRLRKTRNIIFFALFLASVPRPFVFNFNKAVFIAGIIALAVFIGLVSLAATTTILQVAGTKISRKIVGIYQDTRSRIAQYLATKKAKSLLQNNRPVVEKQIKVSTALSPVVQKLTKTSVTSPVLPKKDTLETRLINLDNIKNYIAILLALFALVVLAIFGKTELYVMSSGLIIVSYALFYSIMTNRYITRKSTIQSLTNNAVHLLEKYKDGGLIAQIAKTQLTPEPKWWQICDMVAYRASGNHELPALESGYNRLGQFVIKAGNRFDKWHKGKMNSVNWSEVYSKLGIDGYSMATVRHFVAGIKQEGLSGSNLKSTCLNATDLSGADLQGTDLCGSSLIGCILSKANLKAANMEGAFLYQSDCSGANFSKARLVSIKMRGSQLKSTCFKGCDLTDSDLSETNLANTDFSSSVLSGADFRDANCDLVKIVEIANKSNKSSVIENFPNFSGVLGLESAVFSGNAKDDKKIKGVIAEIYNIELDKKKLTAFYGGTEQ